jgi:hypothetical protein
LPLIILGQLFGLVDELSVALGMPLYLLLMHILEVVKLLPMTSLQPLLVLARLPSKCLLLALQPVDLVLQASRRASLSPQLLGGQVMLSIARSASSSTRLEGWCPSTSPSGRQPPPPALHIKAH